MMNSPIPWLGGKRLLRKRVIDLFPEHKCYVEVFGGGAWVLFGKEPSSVEVLNDIDGELINFYRIVKCCHHELLLELQWDLVSREYFSKLKREEPNPDCSNVLRAKRFFYLIKASFGGQGGNFGVTPSAKPKLNLVEVDTVIQKAHDRLKRVTIEQLDFEPLITRYDRDYTLFYLDPPYRTPSSQTYAMALTDDDYRRLAVLLESLAGKFLLSLNDDEFIRKVFGRFDIQTIQTRYSVMKNATKPVNELIIKNY